MIKFIINEIRKNPIAFKELIVGLIFTIGSSVMFVFLMYILFG
jgi:hypothetical protein|tara:strand:+ start:898 stop:1026 length:129 start_codon:yes stop_codon:yes gene_type:complete